MTKIIFSFFLILSSIQIFAYELPPEALKASHLPQLSHKGEGPYDTYLTMDLPFSPYERLRREIEKKTGPLKHRGEAHITVITPPEFTKHLSPAGVTIEEIDFIAREMKIQSSRFRLVCVGKGELREMQTFYAVAESEDLMNLRRKVAKLYLSKGGSPTGFLPENFYPHVTLGFTERDLHETDGILKDEKTCLENGRIRIRD